MARVEVTSTCWLWTGARMGMGYGHVALPVQLREVHKFRAVHRVIYEQLIGPIPDGMQLDHVWERGCRHKHCVFPGHLEPVTGKENSERRAKLITHCPQDHEYTESNTRIHRGKRRCLTCHRERMRARRAAARAIREHHQGDEMESRTQN